MNEDLLASAVSDWLKETDTPPPDPRGSRAAAVARARARGQVGRWWPLARAFGAPLPTGLSATAAVMVLLVGAILGLRLLAPEDAQRSLTAAPSDSSESSAAIHWRTSVVDLRADDFSLEIEGQTFTTGGSRVMAHSDPGDAGYWTLEVEWGEHGVGQRLNLYFAADKGHWSVREVRSYDGRPRGEWIYAYGPFLRTPLGEAFEGDVRIDLLGTGRPDDPSEVIEATLEMSGARLAVWPGGRPIGLLESLVDSGLGLVRDTLFPQPQRTPQQPEPEVPSVETDFGDLTLRGEMVGDGLMRVFDDGAGNRFSRVVWIDLAPDGTLWVARHKAIFALGRPGEVRIPDDGDSNRQIGRFEVNDDGSLTVQADGVWRLEDGAWTSLEPAPPPDEEDDYWVDEHYRPIVELADGSTWRHPEAPWTQPSIEPDGLGTLDLLTDDGWVSFGPDDVFPAAYARHGEELGWLRALLQTASGDTWAYTGESLSRFDGTAWHEVALAEIAGGPVLIRGAAVDEEGTLVVLATGDGQGTPARSIQRLLRLEDGRWSRIALEGEQPSSLRRPLFHGLRPTRDGRLQLQDRDPDRIYFYDGHEVVGAPELGPHDTVTAADGSVFGTARPRNLGLLMIPAGEIRAIEPVAGEPDANPTEDG